MGVLPKKLDRIILILEKNIAELLRSEVFGMLWCIEPGVPLNWGANYPYTTSEVSQDKYIRASLAVYYGWEKQKSVVNAFYTERLVQEITTRVTSGSIYDYAGMASQSGYNTFRKNILEEVESFFTLPSFAGKSYTVKLGETLILTDTTGNLPKYKVTADTANMTVSQSGNTLKITPKSDSKESGTLTLRYQIAAEYEGATIIYSAPYLLEALPDNKYFWKYGFSERHGFKEPLDRMVNLFLNTDGKETMEKVVRLLKPISDEYESAYGNPRNAPTYYENQLYGKNGLYAQIGNQILHEIRTFAKSQQMQKAVGNMTAEEFDALQKEQAVLPIDLGSSTEQDFISPEMEDVFHLLNEIPPPVEEDEIEQPFIEKSPEVKSDSIPTERSNQLAEAFELMKQHFEKRDESLDQRQMGIQYKLNQENADREDTIERRAMYIHAVDSETDFVHYEPTSIQKHKTLDEEFVSAKEQKSSESEEGNEQHNLDRFSKKNRAMILRQNPGATFVYGPQQWKLNGRKVREDEIDQPLILIAPYKIEDTVVFEEICVYDISQTEAYQPTAAELEELLKKENAKGKSTAPRSVSRFQDRRKEMEMRKMVHSLRRSCENSLQHYLNERAYRELQYESQSNI